MLRSKYSPDQLYMVTGRCDIKESLDLAANCGLIVSVIKREDPMGNSGRWFVDAGGTFFHWFVDWFLDVFTICYFYFRSARFPSS